jgi:hypothetical protein
MAGRDKLIVMLFLQRVAARIVRRYGATTCGACVFARAQVAANAAAGRPSQAERKVLVSRAGRFEGPCFEEEST